MVSIMIMLRFMHKSSRPTQLSTDAQHCLLVMETCSSSLSLWGLTSSWSRQPWPTIDLCTTNPEHLLVSDLYECLAVLHFTSHAYLMLHTYSLQLQDLWQTAENMHLMQWYVYSLCSVLHALTGGFIVIILVASTCQALSQVMRCHYSSCWSTHSSLPMLITVALAIFPLHTDSRCIGMHQPGLLAFHVFGATSGWAKSLSNVRICKQHLDRTSQQQCRSREPLVSCILLAKSSWHQVNQLTAT